MRTRHAITGGLACLVLLAGACTAGGGTSQPPPTINPSTSHAPVTLTIWSFFTNPEFTKFNTAITAFHNAYPWITVNSIPGKDASAVLDRKSVV